MRNAYLLTMWLRDHRLPYIASSVEEVNTLPKLAKTYAKAAISSEIVKF